MSDPLTEETLRTMEREPAFVPHADIFRAAAEIRRLRRELAEVKEQAQRYSDTLRLFAATLGNGGFNAPDPIDASTFKAKIQNGIDTILRVETQRREQAESERDAARREADRWRGHSCYPRDAIDAG